MLINKYINRLKLNTAAAIIFIGIIMSFSIELAVAQIGIDFEVPAPEKSEFVGSHNLKLFGRDIIGVTYKSQETQNSIIAYYRDFFRTQGFKEILNTMLPKDTARRVQFKNENFVAEIILTNKDYGTDVGIAKYTLPQGVSKLDDLPLSVDDFVFSLPQKDSEGEDLKYVPRPPKSVRIGSFKVGNQTYVTYITKLSIAEAVEFYRDKMPFENWELKQDVAMAKLAEDYKRVTGKKDLGLRKMKFPIQGAGNLEETFLKAYTLDFISQVGFVRINVMPNILKPDSGAIVQLDYAEDANEYK